MRYVVKAVSAACVGLVGVPSLAQVQQREEAAARLEPVEVVGNYDNRVGSCVFQPIVDGISV